MVLFWQALQGYLRRRGTMVGKFYGCIPGIYLGTVAAGHGYLSIWCVAGYVVRRLAALPCQGFVPLLSLQRDLRGFFLLQTFPGLWP